MRLSQQSPEARHAQRALHRALLDLAVAGQRPACSDDGRWISNDPDERRAAAARCTGCPVLAECSAAGQFEVAGVWGARDFSWDGNLKGRSA